MQEERGRKLQIESHGAPDFESMTVDELKNALKTRKVSFKKSDKKATLLALLKARYNHHTDNELTSPRSNSNEHRPRSPSEGGIRLTAVEKQILAACDGEGESITYAISHFKDNPALITKVKAMVTANPGLARTRGQVGELPIHFACLQRNLEIMYWFIEFDPELALATYTTTESDEVPLSVYTGENLLHISIVNRDHRTSLRLANSYPKLLEQKTSGTFFTENKPVYEGGPSTPCYFGEFPLFFAASTNQPELFLNLLKINPDQLFWSDSQGNTLLHMCVFHELPKMFNLIANEIKKAVANDTTVEESEESKERKNLFNVCNNNNQAVLVYAAFRGSEIMFVHILEHCRVLVWAYGPVTCWRYPLKHLDYDHGDTKGALEVIVNEDHTHMMRCTIVKDLIGKKWENFAVKHFKKKFVLALCFMALLTSSIVMRNLGVDEENEGLKLGNYHYSSTQYRHAGNMFSALFKSEWGTWNSTVPYPPNYNGDSMTSIDEIASCDNLGVLGEFSQLVGKALSCLWAGITGTSLPALATTGLALIDAILICISVIQLRKEVINEMLDSGFSSYFEHTGARFVQNFCAAVTYSGVLAVGMLRFFPLLPPGSGVEDGILSVVSISGWMHFLYFLFGHPKTGPLVIMMHKMMKNDVFLVTIVYSVFIFGFAQAFYIEFNDVGWISLFGHIKMCILALLGETDFQIYNDNAKHPWLCGNLIIGYVFVMTIMLVNLLVAMMADTYAQVKEENKLIWLLEKTRIIFSIEAELSAEEKQQALSYQMVVKSEKWMQNYEINENHFTEEWCSCNILFRRCKKCNPEAIRDEEDD